jgi:hypothetical protein
MNETQSAHQSAETVCVGSLHFTYGCSGYNTALVAKLFMTPVGLVCHTVEPRASKYNDRYMCQVLSVDFEPGSCKKELSVIIEVRGDGTLGDVQLPHSSRLELRSNHSIIIPLSRVEIEVQNADVVCGTLFYEMSDMISDSLVCKHDTQALFGTVASGFLSFPNPTHRRVKKAAVLEHSLRLDGVRFADTFSIIGTGGLALSERLIGASEGLRGRIMFSGNTDAAQKSPSHPRDDRLLEVLLERNNLEGFRVGESAHIHDLECEQCCKEVDLCVCETKPSAIGAGAQGTVWKYRRSSDQSFVAVKKVNSCSRFNTSWRLDGEAGVMTLLAKNGSQHVIPYYGSFIDSDGVINLSMKFLGKGSLADLLGTRHRLVMPTVSVLALHLLSALHYFHDDLNLLHRDIKPSNIMIEDDGRFVLADLALAILTSTGPPSDHSLAMAGTMQYMSPECLNDGAATPASDLWSFGIVLLEALLGYFPLNASVALASSASSVDPQADLASDSTWEYWRLRSILASVKSPIYLPNIRHELDALGRAFDVEVVDFFERCLHPVRFMASLSTLFPQISLCRGLCPVGSAHFHVAGFQHAL